MGSYEEGVVRLAKRVRLMNEAEYSPTPEKKAAEHIAAKLDELAALLKKQGSAQTGIEELHDRPPIPGVGLDGMPVEPVDIGCSYKATTWHMRALAESAREYAKGLPNPRTKNALPFAANALLHLRYRHGFPRPTLYIEGQDVGELRRIVETAGMALSPERLRNALSDALREFDPHFVPPGVGELID